MIIVFYNLKEQLPKFHPLCRLSAKLKRGKLVTIYCRSKEVAERVKYSTEQWNTCINAFGSHELQLDVLQAAHYCTHSVQWMTNKEMRL